MPGSTAPHLGNPSGVAAASTCSWLVPALGPWGELQGGFIQPFPELCPGLRRNCYPVHGLALSGWLWVTAVPREEGETETGALLPK